MSQPSRRLRAFSGPTVLLVSALCFGGGNAARAGAAAEDPATISPEGLRQIEALLAEKRSRTGPQRKIQSQLLHAAARRRGTYTLQAAVPRLRDSVRVARDGRVEIDVRATVDEGLLARIRELGGEIVNAHPRWDSLRARLPLLRLEELAADTRVRFIRTAEQPIPNKDDTSEGDVAHAADVARPAHGIDGFGVKVGVISDSAESIAALQATGDLPATVAILTGQGGSGTSEGSAMLEIVYDLAPGADLEFSTAIGGQAQFAANIVALQADGCDVIVDDISYLTEPAFQDGPIAQAVDQVVAAGALYFSSAANSGRLDAGQSGLFEGDFLSAPTIVGGYLDVHNFGTPGSPVIGNLITLDSPSLFTLQWADPQDGSTNDYDLLLMDPDLNAVFDSSTSPQDGTQDPREFIDSGAFNDTGNRLVIAREAGSPRYLRLDTHRGRLGNSTAGSVYGHAAAAGAFAVAAVNVATASGGVFVGGAANPIETFSSDGLRRVFFLPDGAPLTPGNFSSTGGQVRQKPDLAAADGVSTSTPGFSSFFGTSAAAPHAAAIAALASEMVPGGASRDEAARLFSITALDVESPCTDRNSGVGLVMADAVLDAIADGLVFANSFDNGTTCHWGP